MYARFRVTVSTVSYASTSVSIRWIAISAAICEHPTRQYALFEAFEAQVEKQAMDGVSEAFGSRDLKN